MLLQSIKVNKRLSSDSQIVENVEKHGFLLGGCAETISRAHISINSS